VVGVEQWAEIRRLHFVKGLSQREIRCRTELHRDTIRRAISNKPFSAWGDIFGDDVVAAAMIDRFVHHAEILRPQRRQLPPQRPRPRPTAGRKLTPDRDHARRRCSALGLRPRLRRPRPHTWWTDRVYFLAFSHAGPDPSLTARSTSRTTLSGWSTFTRHHRPTIRTALTNGGVRRGR
jgi:IstB-like ATP binding protein